MLKEKETKNCFVITLKKKFCNKDLEHFKNIMLRICEFDLSGKEIILNFENLHTIDYPALLEIIHFTKQVNKNGGKLKISYSKRHIKDLFSKTGLNKILAIY